LAPTPADLGLGAV